MILIERGEEPAALAEARRTRLAEARRLRARRELQSDDIVGYDVAKEVLWRRQHFKCCYCETREQLGYNDAEHYRPKIRAQRLPGSTDDHGYWWLAWTWENLLFSCMNCNRGLAKGTRFPLKVGSHALVPEEIPPGREQPLLVDPAGESGIKHIRFVLTKHGESLLDIWKPLPRNGSPEGEETIKVCALDRPELLDLYSHHVRCVVWPHAERVQAAIRTLSRDAVLDAWRSASRDLLMPQQAYVGLSYDALNHFVPKAELAPFGLRWKVFS